MKSLFRFSTVVLAIAMLIVSCKDDPARPEPEPPTVTITFPADSAVVSDTVKVTVNATDDFGIMIVQLFIDDTLHFSDAEAPYEFDWNVRIYQDSSWHKIWAVATDTDTMSTLSDTIMVQVSHSASNSGQKTLIVANFNDGAGTISLLDLVGDNLKKNIVTGVGNTPNDMIWKNSRLYVVNSISNDLNVFSINYNNDITLDGTYDLGVTDNRSPQFADVADNGRMYVSNFNTNDLTVYDPLNGRTLLRIPVGNSPADVMAVGSLVFVCNTGFNPDDFSYDSPGTISVVSTTDNFVIDTISVNGVNPQFMTKDRDNRLHVVCTGDYDSNEGKIYILKEDQAITNKWNVDQVINIGGTPGQIAITQDNNAYVSAGGWTDNGDVYRYNATTGEIFNGPDNPIETGLGAMRIVAASDNSVYVACMNDDQVDKIIADQVVSSFPVGDGPSAMYMLER